MVRGERGEHHGSSHIDRSSLESVSRQLKVARGVNSLRVGWRVEARVVLGQESKTYMMIAWQRVTQLISITSYSFVQLVFWDEIWMVAKTENKEFVSEENKDLGSDTM